MAKREWTVKADKGKTLTAAEIIEALQLVPGDHTPKAIVTFGGHIKELKLETNE